jgi:two-component system nitrogen regulation response regulator NtrX
MTESRCILIIDDERPILLTLTALLERHGYQIESAATAAAGLKLLKTKSPPLVLLDLQLPDAEGLQTLDEIKTSAPKTQVIILTAHDTLNNAIESIKRGAYHFISKPYAPEELLSLVEKALENQSLLRETQELRQRTRQLEKRLEMASANQPTPIFKSKAMQEIDGLITAMAPSDANVLITGESGVGKELVARTIHRNSLRARERFVQVNCAAIPEELIESELFGHEKGSFTGATEKQIGKFEQADRGTIFLDEVGDMSPKTQAKVLRVLQEGEVERIGSARTIKVDVRVIAATNKHLEEEIEKGQFREDLYFRLAVIPIYVPPLRERPEDIPLLVKHFMEQISRDSNVRPKRLTPAAIETLQRSRWKGNIRELRNTAERLIIMTAADTIDVNDLPESVKSPSGAAIHASAAAAGLVSPKLDGEPPDRAKVGTLREFKDNAERAFLVGKLRENGWNISKTAEAIDTPRSNLYKKLEQYQISQETDG